MQVELLHRGKLISVLALYATTGFVSWCWVEGGYDGDTFIKHMEWMVARVIQPYPSDNSILVLDNCRIHYVHEDRLRRAISQRGGELRFLAPYCPIDNPEEKGFSSLKRYWQKHAARLKHMDLDDALAESMTQCYASADGPDKTYVSCGYNW